MRFLQLKGSPPTDDLCRGCNWTADTYLRKHVKIENLAGGIKYHSFQLTIPDQTSKQITGVHFYCDEIGPWGAFDTTVDLLKVAQSKTWSLQIIFVVGCCGVSLSDKKKKEKNWRGTVLLTNVIDDYLHIGKAEVEGKLEPKSRPFDIKNDWLSLLEDAKRPPDGRDGYCDIAVKRVDRFLSGPLVIKDQLTGDRFRGNNVEIAGVEMEVVGVIQAVKACHNILGTLEEKRPCIVLAKGVSDYTGDKGKPAKTFLFGKETKEEEEDVLQYIATLNSTSLVIRFVVQNVEYLCQQHQ